MTTELTTERLTEIRKRGPVGYHCDHSDEPYDARTHHEWEYAEDEGLVFQHMPDVVSSHRGPRDYLSPEQQGQRCPRALPVYDADVPALLAEVDQLRKQAEELDNDLDEAMKDRDTYHDLLDTFASAVAPMEVIGEHSSGNDPWANALELVTPAAEVERLRSELATPKKPRSFSITPSY